MYSSPKFYCTRNALIYSRRISVQGAMCGMLASLGIMAWIIGGAQVAIYNKELMFVEKNVSITGCPANTTFKSHIDYSG